MTTGMGSGNEAMTCKLRRNMVIWWRAWWFWAQACLNKNVGFFYPKYDTYFKSHFSLNLKLLGGHRNHLEEVNFLYFPQVASTSTQHLQSATTATGENQTGHNQSIINIKLLTHYTWKSCITIATCVTMATVRTATTHSTYVTWHEVMG